MFKNVCHQLFKLTKTSQENLLSRTLKEHNLCNQCFRTISRSSQYNSNKDSTEKEGDITDLTISRPNQIFQKEFPDYYSHGKFVNRISYVDFIDQALEKLKELGLERDIECYKELLRVFPPGKYCPKSRWDFGLFHAPQQLCAIRLLFQMDKNKVKPDKEIEALVIQAFSKNSDVWKRVARMNYWSMKSRFMNNDPLPEKLPTKPHELAKVGLIRMLEDPKSIITVANTSSVPDAIDKTWIVYSQSPLQRGIIDRLDPKSILYIENQGLTYVDDKFLSYFVLKVYDDEETIKRREKKKAPDFNYNTVKMKFYGKPIREKLEELDQVHRTDDSHILAVCFTGTSSQDSLLSWLKMLQKRNPKLKDLSVVFKTIRPTMDLLDPSQDPESRQQRQDASN